MPERRDTQANRPPRPPRPPDGEMSAAEYAEARARARDARLAAARARQRRARAIGGGVGLVLLAAVVAVIFGRALLMGPERTAEAGGRAASQESVTQTAAALATEAPAAKPAHNDDMVVAQTIFQAPPPYDGNVPEAVREAAVQYPGAPEVEPQVISAVNTDEKVVAITIDDGIPLQEDLIELFEERDVQVTTFLLGQAVKANPKAVKRMHEAGFEIATHGWDHDSFTSMSESEMRSQLERTQDLITEITGNQAPYFRPPYGNKNDTVVRVAAEQGYKTLMWNGSFVDTSKKASPQYSYKKAMKYLRPGGILLCHWAKSSTVGAMELVLDELDRQGYKVVTVSELLTYDRPEED